jgi:large subunit ribosomal protein L25
MTKNLLLQAVSRKTSDSVAKIRLEKNIPAVIYGHGLQSTPISINEFSFMQILRQAGFTTLLSMTIAGDDQAHPVLIRDVQYHPVKGNILHVDFYQVRLDQKIRADVPLEFIGESAAVKNLNGTLIHPLETIELEALPENLPHNIPVDISVLSDFEKVIHVKDLKLPPGLTIFHEPEEVIALIQPPRSEEELAQLEQEAKEDVKSIEGVEDKEEAVEDSDTDAKTQEEKKGTKD